LAHQYNANHERNTAARNLLTSVTGQACHIGSDFQGVIGPQQKILDGISKAAWFIADLASEKNASGGLKVNLNTCIEFAVALGAGMGRTSSQAIDMIAERPVYALALDCRQDTESEDGKSKDLPWMLQSGITIQWYKNDFDFLAIIHRIAYQHRRRILNLELSE